MLVSKVVEYGHGLAIISIEPSKSSRGYPNVVVSSPHECSSTFKSAPCLSSTGLTPEPENEGRFGSGLLGEGSKYS